MDPTPLFKSDRMFEIWRYTVSHSQLLIRSTKGKTSSTRLELLFKNVAFIAVSPVMKGMNVIECDINYVEIPTWFPVLPEYKWYMIKSHNSLGFVAASAVLTNEDSLEYDDPSPLLTDPAL